MSVLKRTVYDNRVRWGIILGASMLLFFMLNPEAAHAVSDKWYLENAEIMKTNSIISSAIRFIVWGLTKIIVAFAAACENLYDTAFGFIDITNSDDVNRFVKKFTVVIKALMALSLLILGLTLITNHEKKPKIIINLCFLVLCVTCSTWFFGEMNTLATAFKEGVPRVSVSEEAKPAKMAYTAVDSHMVDLLQLDKEFKGLQNVHWEDKDWAKKNAGKMYGAGVDNRQKLAALSYTDVLNYAATGSGSGIGMFSAYEDGTSDILKYRLYMMPDGTYSKVEVANGLGWNSGDDADPMNEFYYRYNFEAVSAWMELIAIIIVYITMSYKCVRIAYELVVARLLAYLYSAELSGGEKIRKIIVFIRDSYILLVLTTLCIRIFSLFCVYLQKSEIAGITKGLFILFIAFAVIDGPNLVEKLLGMDVGLKSSTARMMAIGRIAMGAGGLLSAKNIARKAEGISSGKISEGGLLGGAVGASIGHKEEDGSRSGGIAGVLNSIKGSGTQRNTAGSSGAPGSAGEAGASAGNGRDGTCGAPGLSGASAAGGAAGAPGASSTSQTVMGAPGMDVRSGTENGQNAADHLGAAAQKGDKGEKGDPGHPGPAGKDGREQSTAEKPGDSNKEKKPGTEDKEKARDPHAFMNRGEKNPFEMQKQSGDKSSMPERTTHTRSRYVPPQNTAPAQSSTPQGSHSQKSMENPFEPGARPKDRKTGGRK